MIAAYIFLVLSIQQICQGAIETTVKSLDSDELENTYEYYGRRSWLDKCQNMSTNFQTILHLTEDTTHWLETSSEGLVKDLTEVNKCTGLSKSICVSKGMVKLMTDLQTIPEQVKSRFNLTSELFKETMKELVGCLLNVKNDQPN